LTTVSWEQGGYLNDETLSENTVWWDTTKIYGRFFMKLSCVQMNDKKWFRREREDMEVLHPSTYLIIVWKYWSISLINVSDFDRNANVFFYSELC